MIFNSMVNYEIDSVARKLLLITICYSYNYLQHRIEKNRICKSIVFGYSTIYTLFPHLLKILFLYL